MAFNGRLERELTLEMVREFLADPNYLDRAVSAAARAVNRVENTQDAEMRMLNLAEAMARRMIKELGLIHEDSDSD